MNLSHADLSEVKGFTVEMLNSASSINGIKLPVMDVNQLAYKTKDFRSRPRGRSKERFFYCY
jgi:hypothetical protein